jgi:toluene monooxygenase system protein A
MRRRTEWLDLARSLDWPFSYVKDEAVFPDAVAGTPHLPFEAWARWEEPFRTSFGDYVMGQSTKDLGLSAVHDVVGQISDAEKLDPAWLNAVKLHGATLPLAEFAAVIGNLRGARFGRHSAWRTAATFGALDEMRHTQIPLKVLHDLVRLDPQFGWVHAFYHSNNWVAIAARHLVDELLLASNAIEFAIATNFVFETGFTNLQFVALSASAHGAGDAMFESMLNSIQTDEARHAQIGRPVLEVVAKHDPEYAQYLIDKWFWRSWILFAIVTGFSMDYFTPLSARKCSFKQFVEEWVIDQYLTSVEELGLSKPWYWNTFVEALDYYHHMVYASAYTYRASVWFDFVVPSPRDRAWLREMYPKSWEAFEPVWERIDARWSAADVNNDFAVHGTAIVGFCDMCQVILAGGTPEKNTASTLVRDGKKYIFCSAPCRWIFEKEPHRYLDHKDVVKRVLTGEAPANLVALLRRYFGLDLSTWGKDVYGGAYPWLKRVPR